MTTSSTGRFVWFEYVSRDSAKAQRFYGELFGWGVHPVPMPDGNYEMIALGSDTIGGYVATPPGAPGHAHWLPHLQVRNAADTAGAIQARGGKVLKAPFKVGGFGTMAVVADPLGGALALWQPDKPEGSGDFKGVAYAWCWNELLTEDVARSLAFYCEIAGFTVEDMAMGPGATYHVLHADGKSRAGVMKAPQPGIPQHWMPYVQVPDTDATIAKALALGATIRVAATDIPDVGRLAVFADPLGGTTGVLQPAR